MWLWLPCHTAQWEKIRIFVQIFQKTCWFCRMEMHSFCLKINKSNDILFKLIPFTIYPSRLLGFSIFPPCTFIWPCTFIQFWPIFYPARLLGPARSLGIILQTHDIYLFLLYSTLGFLLRLCVIQIFCYRQYTTLKNTKNMKSVTRAKLIDCTVVSDFESTKLRKNMCCYLLNNMWVYV